MKGNLSAPRELPFNESSYFCQWIIKPPESLLSNNNTGVTLSIMVTGVIGGIRGLAFTKLCFNNQYISLKGNKLLCYIQRNNNNSICSLSRYRYALRKFHGTNLSEKPGTRQRIERKRTQIEKRNTTVSIVLIYKFRSKFCR